MPFTAAKIAIFFTDVQNMGLTLCTTGAFAAEGIATPADLAEFDKEGMESIFRNLRKPLKVLRAGAAGVCGLLDVSVGGHVDDQWETAAPGGGEGLLPVAAGTGGGEHAVG